MKRCEKELLLKKLGNLIDCNDLLVIAKRGDITVSELHGLRRDMRSEGAGFVVVKNTIARLAFSQRGIDVGDQLSGSCGIAFSKDHVAAARLLQKFAKSSGKMEINGGVLQGSVISSESMRALACLPPREVIIGQIAQLLVAPIRNIAKSVVFSARGICRALSYITEKQGGSDVK